MSLRLSSPVIEVPRVGPAKAKLLKKLEITRARDFLYTFPRRYDDFSAVTPIAQLKVGEKMAVRARVVNTKSEWGFQGRRRVLRIFTTLADDTGTLQVTWYNLRFLPPQLWQGRELFVAGTVEKIHGGKKFVKSAATAADGTPHRYAEGGSGAWAMRSPVLEFISAEEEQTHTAKITPVYPETHGVTSRFLRYQVKQLLPLLQQLPEYLPDQVRERHHLMGIHEAIRIVHFPTGTAELERAQQRLRFDELFFLQLAALVRQQQRTRQPAPVIPASPNTPTFTKQLPFTLTSAQARAIEDIQEDVASGTPMNRLLQGDVGSGKSVVALVAAYQVLEAGYTVAYLAPTEILARQQASYFAEVLGRERVALLIGALKQREKVLVKQRLTSPEALVVVGTHALLQEDVMLTKCALVIVDEQHRFGVSQRQHLQQGSDGATFPHLLSMTATPIPRTLSLTVYGDLEVSVLDELPPGRKPITTTIVAPAERDDAIIHILKELHAGRQAYVIAPLVEDSPRLQVKSATATAAEMHELFPDIAIGLLHGQMDSAQKEQVIRNFAAGALQLLVATAVVEVGVNVSNASVMIIEGAERFGLAQLHQFRGRIGRGEQQSYCYLFPTTMDDARNPRLNILAGTTDGFVIAEKDLELRGPGEIYGTAQSGYSRLQVASLLDYPLIKLTRQEAARLLKSDPELEKYPILKAKVEQKNLQTHFE